MLYKVKFNDSPAKIARNFGVTTNALLRSNPHKPTALVAGQQTWRSIQPGETLRIPMSGAVGALGAPGDPLTAVVTTSGPVGDPLSDLKVHTAPDANSPSPGGASKNGVVNVLNWNADGNNQWAQIAWPGDARRPAVSGYSSRAYLVAQAAPSLVQPAALNTTCPPGQQYVPILGCIPIPGALQIPGLPNLPANPSVPTLPPPAPPAGQVLFATVTTSGPVGDPLSDLKVHTAPDANSPSPGGASKNGVVSVVNWNADGNNQWAQVNWPGDSRRPAVSGFASRAYLVPVTSPAPAIPIAPLVQPAALNTTCPPGQTYVPILGCVPNLLPTPPAPGPAPAPTPSGPTVVSCPAGQVMNPLTGQCWTPPALTIPGLTITPVTPGTPAQPPAPAPIQPSPTPGGGTTAPTKAGLSTGAIVGIAVGAAALIGVVGYAVMHGKKGGGKRRAPSRKSKPSKKKKK